MQEEHSHDSPNSWIFPGGQTCLDLGGEGRRIDLGGEGRRVELDLGTEGWVDIGGEGRGGLGLDLDAERRAGIDFGAEEWGGLGGEGRLCTP